MHERSRLATIVIVNHNYEEYVAAAIDSALGQSYQPLQVIVVDDGSTDGSRRVISAYDGRIQAVFQDNAGQGSAYNAGWLAAHGDYVLFLDSDDVLMPEAMDKIVAAFQGNDAVKVQFYLDQVDRELRPLGFRLPSYGFSRIEPRRQIKNYGYYVSPPASGNAFRKSFLDKIMPIANQEVYRRSADGYTTGLAGVAGRIVSISQTLGRYRIHGQNYGGESGVRSIPHLHHMFMRDIKRENTQHEFGAQFGFRFSRDRSRYCPGHTKLRLLSRRMHPETHPIESDRVIDLLVCGLVSSVTFPHLTLVRRLSVAVGFVLLGILPRFMLRHHFNAIAAAQQRNKLDLADAAHERYA